LVNLLRYLVPLRSLGEGGDELLEEGLLQQRRPVIDEVVEEFAFGLQTDLVERVTIKSRLGA
jgi:hypothetical protein